MESVANGRLLGKFVKCTRRHSRVTWKFFTNGWLLGKIVRDDTFQKLLEDKTLMNFSSWDNAGSSLECSICQLVRCRRTDRAQGLVVNKPRRSCRTGDQTTFCQFHQSQNLPCQCRDPAMPSTWTSRHDTGPRQSPSPRSSTCLQADQSLKRTKYKPV